MQKQIPKELFFAEAHDLKVLLAAQIIQDEGIGIPILLGKKHVVNKMIDEYNLDLGNCEILDPLQEDLEEYSKAFYEKRKRKGLTLYEAEKLMRGRNYFGCMMVELGHADAIISGLTKDYPRTIKPALQVIGVEEESKMVAGMYAVTGKQGTYFFSDTTVNVDPTVDELVDIILLTSRAVRYLGVEPRIAVLSYSNFGSSKGVVPTKAAEAVRRVKERDPDLVIDGDIQANFAITPELQQENYPFSELAEKGANTLIFPNLASGNIAYKLVSTMGKSDTVGPILMGMKKPVHVLQVGSTVREIMNMAALAVYDAQLHENSTNQK